MAITLVGTPGALPQPPANAGHLGQGVKYPLAYANGKLKLSSGAESVADSLLSILLTQKGERPMLPGYGAGDLVFEPVDLARIKGEITEQLVLFEPRITEAQVDADFGLSHGEIVLTVVYTVAQEAVPRTLTYSYFVNENA